MRQAFSGRGPATGFCAQKGLWVPMLGGLRHTTTPGWALHSRSWIAGNSSEIVVLIVIRVNERGAFSYKASFSQAKKYHHCTSQRKEPMLWEVKSLGPSSPAGQWQDWFTPIWLQSLMKVKRRHTHSTCTHPSHSSVKGAQGEL